MTYATKSILWIVVGPIASVVGGYMAFMFFAFVVGAGFDFDDIGSPTEKFFGGLALPAFGIIALGGSLFSIVVGIRCVIAHRAVVADIYPDRLQQIYPQGTEQGEQVAKSNGDKPPN